MDWLSAVSFRVAVAIRVFFLLVLSLGTAWAWLTPGMRFAPLVLAVLLILATVELIHYLERSYRAIAEHLDYLRHHDYGTRLPLRHRAPPFAELAGAMQSITDEFRRLSADKAASLQYLEVVIEHVSVALLCVDAGERIRLFNPKARAMLRTPFLHTLAGLDQVDANLGRAIRAIDDGQSRLVQCTIAQARLQLVCHATQFELLGERYKLVSLQDIRDELEQREVESWQRLLQVMTHEIMNSLTPIVSLTEVLREELGTAVPGESPDAGTLTPAMREADERRRDTIERSLRAIETRSRRLLEFVDAYASVANVPAPVMTRVDLREVLEHIVSAVTPDLARNGVALAQAISGELSVHCDRAQLEQVLLNLIRNAVEALRGRVDAHIDLRAATNASGQIVIEVEDNGPGISAEHLERIFVPFFTTKPKGSGIGLSVSRQIMLLNKGGLNVSSRPGAGARFRVWFAS